MEIPERTRPCPKKPKSLYRGARRGFPPNARAMPIHPLPRARRRKKRPLPKRRRAKKRRQARPKSPARTRTRGKKPAKPKRPESTAPCMTTTRRFPRGLSKPKPAPNPREKKPPAAQVARRVGKATMAGMKRFNAFSYSQGDGKRRVFRIPLTFRFFILASFIIIFLMLLALNNQSISVDEETIAIAGPAFGAGETTAFCTFRICTPRNSAPSNPRCCAR